MPNLTQLRLAAREIFDETLKAVDAGAAVQRALRLDGSQLNVCDTTLDIPSRKIYSVAIGKAAAPMAQALEQTLGDSFTAGCISAPPLSGGRGISLSSKWSLCAGGHPLPNQQSLQAASDAFSLLQRANEERALVIFLISGGGSAMLERPINESISLQDLQTANQVLVNCGAEISEINSVRRAFSAVKGGRLAMRAANCDQITLLVSDVPIGLERNVASGPTLLPPGDAPNALEVIQRYNLRSQLPNAITSAIDNDSAPPDAHPFSSSRHFVLLDNHKALEAAATAAQRLGLITEMATDISDQPIAEGCRQLAERLNALRIKAKANSETKADAVCLISGGEFACPVRGEGLGGRNLETALRLANQRASNSAQFVALCAGTDGIDGNSPAAGAIVDSTTGERARTIGLDPETFIDRSDAYSFFVALGDVIATGATGTNVRDVRILLSSL